MPLVEDAEDDIPERTTVERYIAACSRRPGRLADPFAVLELVRLERDLKVPAGLLSAAACWESGYTANARGDWRNGVARAHGILQLHAPFLRACGLTAHARDSLEASARCYAARFLARLEEVQGCANPVAVAEALVANTPRYLPWGCAARSAHWREWAAWGLR